MTIGPENEKGVRKDALLVFRVGVALRAVRSLVEL